jgi:acyl-CoA dehydrogenase
LNFEYTENVGFQEYFGGAHNMVRRSVKEFVDKEILPYVDEWEENGEFPRDLYKKAGEVGILGTGYPEDCGGTPGDIFFQVGAWEEIMWCGSGGVPAGLGSLNIVVS